MTSFAEYDQFDGIIMEGLPHSEYELGSGAGSIVSTAKDLLRFMKAIVTGKLISPGLKE